MYPFSLKCQNNIFKRRNSGGYLEIVKIKIKICFDCSVLDNTGISDLGTVRTGDLKKVLDLGDQQLLKRGTLSCLGGVGYTQECAKCC